MFGRDHAVALAQIALDAQQQLGRDLGIGQRPVRAAIAGQGVEVGPDMAARQVGVNPLDYFDCKRGQLGFVHAFGEIVRAWLRILFAWRKINYHAIPDCSDLYGSLPGESWLLQVYYRAIR